MIKKTSQKTGCFRRLEAPFLGVNGAFKKITGLGRHPRTNARLTSPPVSDEIRDAGLSRALRAGLPSGFQHLQGWFWYVLTSVYFLNLPFSP